MSDACNNANIALLGNDALFASFGSFAIKSLFACNALFARFAMFGSIALIASGTLIPSKVLLANMALFTGMTQFTSIFNYYRIISTTFPVNKALSVFIVVSERFSFMLFPIIIKLAIIRITIVFIRIGIFVRIVGVTWNKKFSQNLAWDIFETITKLAIQLRVSKKIKSYLPLFKALKPQMAQMYDTFS